MRVAVLGAGGTIAPAIVRDLASSEEVTALRLLDLDLRRAEAVAAEHGGGKAQARQADATGDLAEQLDGMEVMVNSAAYRINLAAMRACLDAGCHYMDLGGLYHVTAEQLELSAEFEQRGRWPCWASDRRRARPTCSRRAAVRELPGKPVSISVLAAGRDLDPPEGLSFPYAVRTLLDEITMAPMALSTVARRRSSRCRTGPARTSATRSAVADTIFTLHSEVLTFGDSFKAPNVTFALSLSPKVLESLKELSGASEERIAEVARSASPPSANTLSIHIVEVAGPETVIRARSVTPPNEAWGLGGGIVSTASPAAAAVRLLARGSISGAGRCHPRAASTPMRCSASSRRAASASTSGAPADEAPAFRGCGSGCPRRSRRTNTASP